MAGPVHFEVLHVVASLEGGAARHILHLAKELRIFGHRSAIAAPSDQPTMKTELEGSGFTFFELPTPPLQAIQRMETILNSQPFTHLHVHGHRAAFFGRWARDRIERKMPLIYTVHGYHPTHYQNPASRWIVNGIERIFSSKTDAYICVSSSTHNDLIQSVPLIEPRCFVVENGIPLNQFSIEEFMAFREKGRKDLKLAKSSFVLGTAARLHWQKGIPRLLSAFKNVLAENPALRLLIVGEGPEKAALQKQARSLELGKKCVFAGKYSDMSKIYPIMDVFVLPSLWEGLPLTVLEAWNAGIPVVATDVPGSRELIEDEKTGFLAENSVEGIENALRKAYQETAQFPAITKNALNCLKERYTVTQMTEKTVEIYEKTARMKKESDNSEKE
jgi:glycosyltransferase involved in cell wall biosynthesis